MAFKLLLKILYLIINLHQIICDNLDANKLDEWSCGQIAVPSGAKILVNGTEVGENVNFLEQTVVQYDCRDKDFLLIGNNVRKCVRGYWKGSVPRCAHWYYNKSIIKSIKFKTTGVKKRTIGNRFFNQDDFRFANNTDNCLNLTKYANNLLMYELKDSFEIHYIRLKLFGNKLRERITKQDIKIKFIINDDFEEKCTLKGVNEINENNKYLFIDFICETNEKIDEIKLKIIKESFAEKDLLFCDIRYYYFNSSCGEPDLPLSMNGYDSDSLVGNGYDFDCIEDNHFMDGYDRVRCSPFGEWMDDFPQCLPKSVCKPIKNIFSQVSIGFVNIRYESKINGKNEDFYVSNGMFANFSCNSVRNGTQSNESQYILQGVNSVECRDGEWEGLNDRNKPKCLPQIMIENELKPKTITNNILFILSAVLLIILFLIIILITFAIISRKRKQKLLERKQSFDNNFNDIVGDETYDEIGFNPSFVATDEKQCYDLPLERKTSNNEYEVCNTTHTYGVYDDCGLDPDSQYEF